jgi:outer membrane lipoprotein-sorting protein
MTIRAVLLCLVFLPACLAWADDDVATGLVQEAFSQISSAKNAYVSLTGEVAVGEKRVAIRVNAYRSGPDKFRIETYEGKSFTLIIADGSHIWRWDPAAKEYTIVAQAGGFGGAIARMKTLGPAKTAIALNLLAGDTNLLAFPETTITNTAKSDAGSQYTITMRQLVGKGEATQGEQYTFKVWKPIDGETALRSVEFTKVTGSGSKRVMTTWKAVSEPMEDNTTYASWFQFSPPPKARAVGNLALNGN